MLRHLFFSRLLPLAGSAGHPLGQALRMYRRAWNWSAQQLAEHQGRCVAALMAHCHEQVPYYRRVMDERGLAPSDFRCPRDLARLPFLTRDILRKEGDNLRAKNIPDARCITRRSGGTTGEPIAVAVDRQTRAMEMGAYLRGFEKMGHTMGSPMVKLFGGSLGFAKSASLPARIRNQVFDTRFLPAFELGEHNAPDYIRTVQEAKGGVLVGYCSAIRNLAGYMDQAGQTGSPLAAVICTAEHMPEDWRTFIKKAFGCPVFCYYGCGEVNSLGYEAKGETGYVIPGEHVIVETATKDPARFEDQGTGEACVTTLFNWAMPLLRYKNGDMVSLGYEAGGRPHQRITALFGRVMEQLTATDGRMVSGVVGTHLVFQSQAPVDRYQLVQTGKNRLVFRFKTPAKNSLGPAVQQNLTRALRDILGQDMKVDFEPGGFETTRAGKHRFVINRLLDTEGGHA